MRLKLNGKDREVPDLTSIDELIRHLGIHRMIVVEHNGEIIPRNSYASQPLAEGDTLEIVHMVGGG